MMIDWGALLTLTPAKVGACDTAGEPGAACAVATDTGIVARACEGDDRRRCTECGNLGERGLCLAAHRGEIMASRSYTPMRDILRRCEGFAPLPTDPDQRHGRDKWRWLIEAVPACAAVSPAPTFSNDAPK